MTLLGLDWVRVDLIQLRIQLDGIYTKAGGRGEVPLCSSAQAAILRRARFRAEHCPASPWVFAFRDGRQVKDIRGAFAAACYSEGIGDFSFHDLRRLAGKRRCAAGRDP